MTKDQKYQLYLLVADLQDNLVKLHASGSTGTVMDESLDILNKMVGYFIISGIDKIMNEKAEMSAEEEQHATLEHENWRQNSCN